MNKKKIINSAKKRKHIPNYYICWKSGDTKVINFAWYGSEGLAYALYVLKKRKQGIKKKPYIFYINKMTFKEYMDMKPDFYKWGWFEALHSGYGEKVKDFSMYRNFDKWLKELMEKTRNIKAKAPGGTDL